MKRSCNFSDSDNESLPKRSNLEAVQYSELGLTDVQEHGVERYEVVESSNTSLAHNVIFERSVLGSLTRVLIIVQRQVGAGNVLQMH